MFLALAMRQGFVVAPFDGKVAVAGAASYIAVECGDAVGVLPHDVRQGWLLIQKTDLEDGARSHLCI